MSSVAGSDQTLTGTHSVDTEFSVKGNQPDVWWNVNGTTHPGPTLNVQLPHGNYTATFNVDDGTFKATDTASISITDTLRVATLYDEAICLSPYSAQILFRWSASPDATYYETEWKPQGGNWASQGTTTINEAVAFPSGISVNDAFRVRACTSNRCGAFRTNYYYTPDCTNHNNN